MKTILPLILLLAFTSCSTTEPTTSTASREPAAFWSSTPKILKMRFQTSGDKWDQGVRLAEYRTPEVDVTYKVLKVEPPNMIFKVYISNVGKKILRVNSGMFNITSLLSKKSVVAENSLWADEKKPVPSLSLNPGESASSELKFAVTDPVGRWTLKNKITSHSFNFLVSDN